MKFSIRAEGLACRFVPWNKQVGRRFLVSQYSMGISESQYTDGILLLYHRRLSLDATTVMEHVNSFRWYSRFKVLNVNTFSGFPRVLKKLRFKIVLLHYSLFGGGSYCLDEEFLRFIEESQFSYKIAFFQDEMQFCQKRFAFINKYQIDCIYTLVEPQYFPKVYGKHTGASKIIYGIPGYVSDELVAAAKRVSMPDGRREVDVGYRGRKLPLYMGKGAQEKYEIALGFKARAKGLGLKLDIQADEHARLYGKAWHRFMANCRAVLGVEAGGSIFDVNDDVYEEYCRTLLGENVETSDEAWYAQFTRLVDKEKTIDAEEVWCTQLSKRENNIPYRTISPRHFEAAAFRVCQILFEGKYSGIMQPMVHYIPLKKDFSNFDEVIRMFKDEKQRREITDNAYRDLIASGNHSYQNFIDHFDRELLEKGLRPHVRLNEIVRVSVLLHGQKFYLQTRRRIKQARSRDFPGRAAAVAFTRPFCKLYRKMRRDRSAKTNSASTGVDYNH